jgi:hypothetical protein
MVLASYHSPNSCPPAPMITAIATVIEDRKILTISPSSEPPSRSSATAPLLRKGIPTPHRPAGRYPPAFPYAANSYRDPTRKAVAKTSHKRKNDRTKI